MTKSEQWQQYLSLWRESGLSQVEFCQQHNIAVHNFQYWRKRLSPKTEPAKSKRLIPITVRSSAPARLTLGAQVMIELPAEALPDLLLALNDRGLLYVAA